MQVSCWLPAICTCWLPAPCPVAGIGSQVWNKCRRRHCRRRPQPGHPRLMLPLTLLPWIPAWLHTRAGCFGTLASIRHTEQKVKLLQSVNRLALAAQEDSPTAQALLLEVLLLGLQKSVLETGVRHSFPAEVAKFPRLVAGPENVEARLAHLTDRHAQWLKVVEGDGGRCCFLEKSYVAGGTQKHVCDPAGAPP